jgi:hypothetical protein
MFDSVWDGTSIAIVIFFITLIIVACGTVCTSLLSLCKKADKKPVSMVKGTFCVWVF